MKQDTMDARSERILELLARGSSSRELAQRLGYQEGTMRVYLHHLYRRIGVANKTEAVIWYLKRGQAKPAAAPEEAAAGGASGDIFGDMALREGLYAALGVMSAFVGPYSRVWEVAQRLSGEEADEDDTARREHSRALWKALLQGDWAYGKRLHDAGAGEELLVRAPSDAVQLAALLALGGYSGAAQRLTAQLAQRRRAGGATARELGMLRALSAAVEDGATEALAEVQSLAAQKSAGGLRQVALVVLFHAYALRKDVERARKAADAVWNEAETAKQQLIAMGERPFGAFARSPAPAPAKAASVREKATVR